MKLTRKTYATRQEKILDALVGVVGWILLNALMIGIVALVVPRLDPSNSVAQWLGLLLVCVPFLVNILVMIVFGFTRYWIAVGALATFVVLLIVLPIAGGILVAAICFSSSLAS